MFCPLFSFAIIIAALCQDHQSRATALATPSAASMTRRAIELSNKANVDPSFAEEACILWSSILNSHGNDSELPLPFGAMPAAHALHASTLARVGRDKEAIAEYQKSLAFLKDSGALLTSLTKEEVDIRVGMGKSLQRMLRYREAADSFLDAASRCADIKDDISGKNKEVLGWVDLAHSDSIQRAVLCNMRIGDLDAAVLILEKFEGQGVELAGMLGALLHIQMQSPNSTMKDTEKREQIQTAEELLRYASYKSSSPLYNWIYLTSHTDWPGNISVEPFQCKQEDVYLSFAKANSSPFDDPDLINLDDKILLHHVVMAPCHDGKEFWPRGYILPQELDSFVADCNGDGNIDNERQRSSKKWILKERSGYGSHGNSIVSTDEVLAAYDSGKLTKPILCQRIVDPPMLINDRKFSLRIYVVYFPGGKTFSEDGGKQKIDADIYISTKGLVKYASAPYVDDTEKSNAGTLDDQYMTNSGRGDGRSSEQNDLKQLQRELEKKGLNFENMWSEIEESIQMVMKRFVYLQSKSSLMEDALAESSDSSGGYSFIHSPHAPICSIPKIMGFDYVLDASMNPYLLEVNRFPGLGPRSSMDSFVKQSIVYDAWITASDRIGMPKKYTQDLRPSNYKEFSLKRLSLT